MNAIRHLMLSFASVALVFSFATWGYLALAAPGDYVPPPIGATFVYAQKNTGSYGNGSKEVPIKVEARTWEGKQVAAIVGPEGVTIQSLVDSGWITILRPDGKPVTTFHPPAGYEFPLTVGKTWKKTYQVTLHAQGKTLPVETSGKVEGYEDVTVPAGTFKAFKITTSDSWGTQSVEWTSPELGMYWVKRSLNRSDKHPSGPGTRESELVSQTAKK